MDIMDTDDDDCVVRELDVYLCNDTLGAQLCVFAHPLRAPWRPYNYDSQTAMRMKPEAKRIEIELPLSTAPRNYNADDEHYKQIEKVSLRSQQVEQPAVLAMGTLQDGKLLLAPVDLKFQMRPTMTHLNIIKKPGSTGGAGNAAGENDDDDEEEAEPQLRAVEVTVSKRETERQQQARMNSYAFLAQKEAEEPWKNMRVHMDDTVAARKVWDRIMHIPPEEVAPQQPQAAIPSPLQAPQQSNGSAGPLTSSSSAAAAPPHQPPRTRLRPLTRSEYLRSFAPSAVAAQERQASGLYTQEDGGGASGAAAIQAPTLKSLTDACKQAFAQRMQALFLKHSVCSLDNIRQWLLDPKFATNEAQKTAATAAKDAALLENQHLHELVTTASNVPLLCIRRMYVLKETGKQDMDEFRKVVIELLKDKEGFRKNEVTEAAQSKGIKVSDSMYIRVLRDLCCNRANMWQLKNGADF